MEIDVTIFEKLEKNEEIISEKKTRVFPSEIGSWEYCNLKWLYERQKVGSRK